ncbi:MAG: hypothetical protein C0506_02495 [Anaerolinea sp.]|nr:hypothetical protein [Anaerolinea sp.]
MSESQTPPNEDLGPPSPAALRDMRWLAAVLWSGLLLALLFTSVKAMESYTQGTIATRYFGVGPQADEGSDPETLAIAGLALSGLAALAIVTGWYQFVRATKALLVAYGYSGRADEEPSPNEWVTEDDKQGSRTMLSDVLQYVGLAWAVIIVTPAALAAVQAFA